MQTKHKGAPRPISPDAVEVELDKVKQKWVQLRPEQRTNRKDPESDAINEEWKALSQLQGALEGAKERYENAKLWMIRHHAFYGSFLCQIEQFWSTDVALAATNGIKLALNPLYVTKLTNEEMRFLLMHEIQHIAHIHGFRRKGRDKERWNRACDYAVNALIEGEHRMKLHPSSLYDDRFENMAPEEIFTILEREEPRQMQQNSGSQGEGAEGDQEAEGAGSQCKDCGGGGGDQSSGDQEAPCPSCGKKKPEGEDKLGAQGIGNDTGQTERLIRVDWAHGDVLDEPDKLDNVEKAELAARIKRLAYESAFYAKAMGQDTTTVKKIIQSMEPKTSWQLSLSSFVEAAIEKDDYTWARPRRRYVPQGIYVPDMGGTRPPKELAIAVDVSGSVNEKMLELFLEEMSAMVYANPELSYRVYAVDTQIKSKTKIGIEDMPIEWTVQAGGGTNFRPAFEDIQDNDYPVSGLVYFTDMYCHSYPREPEFPVMWLNFGHQDLQGNEGSHYYPPFGEVVDMRMGGG